MNEKRARSIKSKHTKAYANLIVNNDNFRHVSFLHVFPGYCSEFILGLFLRYLWQYYVIGFPNIYLLGSGTCGIIRLSTYPTFNFSSRLC